MHNQKLLEIGFNIDCLGMNACKTPGKERLKWSFNVLTDTTSIEAMLVAASHFTGIKKWRVAGRYIAQPGHVTVDFLAVSKIERVVLEAALLAASTK
jgi:hypothetical protein